MDTDHKLLQELKSGDTKTYEVLYERYFPMLKNHVLKNSGSEDEASDLFQDVMLVLHKNVRKEGFELTSSLKTYVFAIGKNQWYKKLREKKKFASVDIQHLENNEFLSEEPVVERMGEKTLMEKVMDLMDKITPHCNSLLRSIFFKEKSIEEIQEEYGYTTKHNAQNQKYKCMKQLKKAQREAV